MLRKVRNVVMMVPLLLVCMAGHAMTLAPYPTAKVTVASGSASTTIWPVEPIRSSAAPPLQCWQTGPAGARSSYSEWRWRGATAVPPA